MSITNQKTIWCDGCVEWIQISCIKAMTIRKEAKSEGWTYKKGKDYCPECSERKK